MELTLQSLLYIELLQIGPSILNSDLGESSSECQRMLDSGADYLHLGCDGRPLRPQPDVRPPGGEVPPPEAARRHVRHAHDAVADLRGGARDAPPPLGANLQFFHFHAVFGKKNRFAHPLGELASPPPPGENPGSATVMVAKPEQVR